MILGKDLVKNYGTRGLPDCRASYLFKLAWEIDRNPCLIIMKWINYRRRIGGRLTGGGTSINQGPERYYRGQEIIEIIPGKEV